LSSDVQRRWRLQYRHRLLVTVTGVELGQCQLEQRVARGGLLASTSSATTASDSGFCASTKRCRLQGEDMKKMQTKKTRPSEGGKT